MATKISFDKKTLKRLLKFVSNYKAGILLSLIFSVIFTVSSLSVPVIVGKMIDFIEIGDYESLYSYTVLAVVSVVLGCASQTLLGIINGKITYSVLYDIRKTGFEKITKLKVAYIDSHPHGDIVSRILSDSETVSDGLLMGFTQFFTGALTIIATLVIMFIVNPVIALAVFVLTPLSLFVSSYIAKKTNGYFKKQSEIKGLITSQINETVGSMETVHYLGISDIKANEFAKINEEYRVSSHNAVFFSSLINPTTRFVNATIYAVVAGLGAVYCVFGGLSIGSLSVFLNYAGQYTKPFNEISGVMAELQNALACASRIFDFLDVSEITPSRNEHLQNEISGHLEIKNMSFGYLNKKKLYDNFSLDVLPGKKVAIVGPTGCGKTTLINLLMRFYEPQEGEILLDGVNISELPREELRSCFGMVLQDTFIMHGTVFENIRMGNENATDDEIIEAAKKCKCHGFISRLKDGYNTVLAENGEGLSDGQKQLLCICRAMVSNPKILILDEATSSIDTRTEMKVQKAMDTLSQGKTAFIVAHRLSTIVNSDVILAMQKGVVAERGTHAELMEKKGYYYELFNSQFNHH